MELIELARTIQAEKNRALAEESLRRRLLSSDEMSAPDKPAARRIVLPHRPTTGAVSR